MTCAVPAGGVVTPRFASILRTVAQLGEAMGTVEPADELRLAHDLAEHVGEATVAHLVVLLSHPNARARRAALVAVRRAGFWSSSVLVDSVIERLADPVAAVRFAAATALATRGAPLPEAIDALRVLAGGTSAGDTMDASDEAQRARVAAAIALLCLGGPRRSD